MRRNLLILAALTLTAVPAALGAGRSDGTLSLKSASGLVAIAARGSFIGRCDGCRLVVDDPDPSDGPPPSVTGWGYVRNLPGTKTRYGGTDVHFRLIDGFFRLQIVGTGISLSAVGRGSVTLRGDGFADGTYSLDGGPFASMPDVPTSFQLGD